MSIEQLGWEFTKERFKEKKKGNTLSTKKKVRFEKKEKTRFRPKKEENKYYDLTFFLL